MKDVKVYSVHYNRPDFIKFQKDCLNYFLLDTHQLIIVNNAREETLRQEINSECQRCDLQVIENHSDISFAYAGWHHAAAMNYVWQNYMIHHKENYVMFLDGDCFLVAPFSVNFFMNGSALGGVKQKRNEIYHYLTPVVLMADIGKLSNAETIDWIGDWVGDKENGTYLDTAGGLYNYLQNHLDIKNDVKGMHNTRHITEQNGNMHCLPDDLLVDYRQEFEIEFYGNEFLHYCRSSNWDYKSNNYHKLKTQFVKRFIYEAISGQIKAKEHNFQINHEFCGW